MSAQLMRGGDAWDDVLIIVFVELLQDDAGDKVSPVFTSSDMVAREEGSNGRQLDAVSPAIIKMNLI